MQFCRFWRPQVGPAIGFVDSGKVYDLSAAGPEHFGSFSRFLASNPSRAVVEAAFAQAKSRSILSYTDLDIAPDSRRPHLLPPLTKQEVWAAGVTYLRSREARMEESAEGGSFYDKVYRADRPELFFKATPNRVAGPNDQIRIRRDSSWNVPEPELALLLSPKGELVAFTIGNDVSSRDIEGENPLYLPQAKVYRGSCALGPTIVPADSIEDARKLTINLMIKRGSGVAFEGSTSISRMKRTFEELISYLYREQEFPNGAILLTGTGIVPPDDFTLKSGDVVEISVPGIGTLRNPVA